MAVPRASCTRVRTRRNLFTSLPRPFEAAIARSRVPESKLSVGVIGDRTSEYYFLYRLVIIPTMFNDGTGFRIPLPLNFNFDLFDRNNRRIRDREFPETLVRAKFIASVSADYITN